LSGKETETQAQYFVVDSMEVLSKFGADAWDHVVCVITTGQAWQFRLYKWNEPIQAFSSWCGRLIFFWIFFWDLILLHQSVKGIYITGANDPPNAKINDWNVLEPKVRLFILVFCVH